MIGSSFLRRIFPLLLVAFCSLGAAQDAPVTRPVKLVVPAGAGSTIDGIARLLAPQLSSRWGQPVVVENVAGAGGVLGAQAVARANADALTLGVVASNLAVSPALQKKPPYDVAKDFAYLAYLASAPMVLYANPAVPASNFKELQQAAAARNRPFTYSSAGIGSTGHLAGELISDATRLPLNHVAYKAVGQALTDAIGGQVELFIAAASVGAEHVKAGRLKALAHTGSGALTNLPGVSSLPDAGLPDVRLEAWFGVVAPASLPAPLRARMERDVLAAANSDAFKEFAAQQGLVQGVRNGEAFAALVKREAQRWQAMAAKGIIEAQ
ncbi:MAG TPA: tripartite tricarboxylate transporter substrate binding protein [Ramlibacter sp.]|nr:tripartite tricarboxylate transporter substrate binding protein [Ramlibacter sp.]